MKRLGVIIAVSVCLMTINKGYAVMERDTLQGLPSEGYEEINDTIISLPEPVAFLSDSMLNIDDPVELIFESNLDSLLNLWYVNNAARFSGEKPVIDSSEFIIPDFPDSVYIDRLSRIPSVIDMSFNRVVRNYIDVYTKNRREQMEMMLGMTEYYFPMFEQVLDFYDLPIELRYLPVVESALNPRAVSRAGATGIWQFMFGTARMYNLTMNSLVDERRDPYASTHAAARYLGDLYKIYNDWTLALAAYNCGPGNVNRAIRRAGGSRNYWQIYYFLPRETRGYVPAFVAATYAMNYHEEHALYPAGIELPFFTDTIMINRELHLMQVAEVLNIPIQLLRDINPQYRRDIIPAGRRSYALRLPVTYASDFAGHKDSIHAYRADHFLKKENLTVVPGRAGATPDPPPGTTQVTYTVKSGDNLGFISEWYKVGLSSLRAWNNIRGNLIRVGQRIVVYVPNSQADYYREVNNLRFAEKQARIGKTPTVNQPAAALSADESGEYLYYTVRQGDTLWEIARRFPGISDRDILSLNRLSNANRIYPGQQLRIRPAD